MTTLLSASANTTHRGIAVGLAGTFRLLGGAIATAIYTAILTNRYGEVIVQKLGDVATDFHLSEATEQALLIASAKNTPAAYATVPGITDSIIAATEMAVKLSYVQGFKLVYLVSIGFGGLAVICAFCTKNIDSSKKTSEKAVVLKNELAAMKNSGNSADNVV